MSLLVDTHAHLYANAFSSDRAEMIARAKAVLSHIFLPNVDEESIAGMHELVDQYPGFCFPMMGLHPCSVTAEYKSAIALHEKYLRDFPGRYCGIGETGLDYYWDKTHIAEQKEALNIQIEWAKDLNLPLILHCRESMDDVIEMVEAGQDGKLRGIFHCFTGSVAQAQRIVDANFLLGIGGVVTYKNSGLDAVLPSLALEKLVLETDAPYLAPVPFRGKRNESARIVHVAEKIAEIKNMPLTEVARVTSQNAIELFGV